MGTMMNHLLSRFTRFSSLLRFEKGIVRAFGTPSMTNGTVNSCRLFHTGFGPNGDTFHSISHLNTIFKVLKYLKKCDIVIYFLSTN
jgi:hypothetical protein